MGSNIEKKVEDIPLYILVKKLDSSVQNKDDVGLLIGYSLIESLMHHQARSHSDEERKFEEIKEIRKGMQRAVSSCITGNSYPALCSLTTKVDPEISTLLELEDSKEKKDKTETTLFLEIIESLKGSKGNYKDRIKRRGLKLKNAYLGETERRGKEPNKSYFLNRDYAIIIDNFVRER